MANEVEFLMVGCSLSNMSDFSHPFAIVVLEPVGDGFVMKAYILRKWQNLQRHFPDELRPMFLGFIDELKEMGRGKEPRPFFEHLKRLGVGALRSMGGGLCGRDALDSHLESHLSGQDEAVFWPDSFRYLDPASAETF